MGTTGRFACLRCHSWFSWMEGVSGPEALLERAATNGYQALALTDSNNLSGTVELTQLAQRYNVRVILGACLRHQTQRVTALVAEPNGYREGWVTHGLIEMPK
jgi:error-prone DNA polymerase